MSRQEKTIKMSMACADHFHDQCPGHLGEPNFRCMCECHTTNPSRLAVGNRGHFKYDARRDGLVGARRRSMDRAHRERQADIRRGRGRMAARIHP